MLAGHSRGRDAPNDEGRDGDGEEVLDVADRYVSQAPTGANMRTEKRRKQLDAAKLIKDSIAEENKEKKEDEGDMEL